MKFVKQDLESARINVNWLKTYQVTVKLWLQTNQHLWNDGIWCYGTLGLLKKKFLLLFVYIIPCQKNNPLQLCGKDFLQQCFLTLFVQTLWNDRKQAKILYSCRQCILFRFIKFRTALVEPSMPKLLKNLLKCPKYTIMYSISLNVWLLSCQYTRPHYLIKHIKNRFTCLLIVFSRVLNFAIALKFPAVCNNQFLLCVIMFTEFCHWFYFMYKVHPLVIM